MVVEGFVSVREVVPLALTTSVPVKFDSMVITTQGRAVKVTCLKCGSELELTREGLPNFAWLCPANCLPPLDTGVPITEKIERFEREVVRDGKVDGAFCASGLSPEMLAGAKVYMPHLLMHYVECTWGPCYNSIYLNLLVPHLDCPPALDYVLRSPVVRGAWRTGSRSQRYSGTFT